MISSEGSGRSSCLPRFCNGTGQIMVPTNLAKSKMITGDHRAKPFAAETCKTGQPVLHEYSALAPELKLNAPDDLSGLVDHCYDAPGARINDHDLVAHDEVAVAAIGRDDAHNFGRHLVQLDRRRNDRADVDREVDAVYRLHIDAGGRARDLRALL